MIEPRSTGVFAHTLQSSREFLEDNILHRDNTVSNFVQSSHDAFHDVLVLVQISIVNDMEQRSEQVLKKGFDILTSNLFLHSSRGRILESFNLFDGVGGQTVHDNKRATKMGNQERHQSDKLLLSELVAENANEVQGRRFDHRTLGGVIVLKFWKDLEGKEFHQVDTLIQLRNTIGTFFLDCYSQEQRNGSILGNPLVVWVGSKLCNHLFDMIRTNRSCLSFKLPTHGTQKLPTTPATGFVVRPLEFCHDELLGIVLEILLITLAYHQVRNYNMRDNLPQGRFVLE
mmetsp:Transcript_9385/g.17061  ORF Transcript_9385/g.17061 Transcript_9385/m.17061 type:complete len:286 (+) Transcript_9385:2143-3000(+)